MVSRAKRVVGMRGVVDSVRREEPGADETLLSRLSLHDIHDIASASAFNKGQQYWRQGRVVGLDIEDGGAEIRARVQGNARRPYTQTISLEEEGPYRLAIEGACSCPVGVDCKHVVAALFAALARRSSDGEPVKKVGVSGRSRRLRIADADDDYRVQLLVRALARAPAPASPPPPPAEVLAPNLSMWIDALARLDESESEDYPPSVRQRLLYVLDLLEQGTNPARLIAEPMVGNLRKDDSMGHARRYPLSSFHEKNVAKFVRPSDRDILNRLQQAPHVVVVARGAPLSGEEGVCLLRALIATGRARWGDAKGPLVTLGPPRRGRAIWRLTEDASHRVDFEIDGKGANALRVACLAPPWYADARTGKVGPIETGFAPRVAERLLSAPPAPPRQVHLLRAAIEKRLPSFASVAPPEIPPPTRIAAPPVPVLRLMARHLPDPQAYWRRADARSERVSLARLSFSYGGIDLALGDGRDAPTFVRDGRIVEIARDRGAERRARDRLGALRFMNLSALRPFNLPNEYKSDLAFSERAGAWLDFIYRDAPALRAEGWRVEIDPDFPVQLVRAGGEVFADFREGSGIDWFELDLGVLVDGERVDLTPALLAAIADPRVSAGQARASDGDAPIFLPLPDGRTLALPRARIQPLLAALYELLNSGAGDPKSEKLGFSLLDAASLADFEATSAAAGLQWRGGERLRELGRLLRETGGIPSAQVPASFAGELRPYQARGVDWLQFLRTAGLGGVLADDMGLGKTVQTLAHIAIEKEEGRLNRPALVVAPTSLVANWRREAERFAPQLKVLALHGPDRKTRFAEIEAHDLVITTYPLLARDHEALHAQAWHMVVLDEAQTIKNPDAATTRLARQIEARSRLCLTGTPLENHLGELWSLFAFLSPGFLGDRQSFNRRWRNPIEKHGDRERQLLLARRVRPFLLRRAKAEVAAELPPKTEIVEAIEMEPAQRDLYESVRLTMHSKVMSAIAAKGLARSRIIVLDALLKLRQVCCDPRLLKLKTVAKARSAKLARLMEMLPDLIEEGRRILLFSQFTSMLALIEKELQSLAIPYVLLTGDTRDRATPIGRFQAGEVPVFLISLKAGGVGLNLTAADTVIHYDPWWNPAVEDQASDRAHRIGQTKPVFVHKLMTLSSIEEKMEALKGKKRALAQGLFDPEAGGALDLTEADVEALFGAA